MTIKKKVAAMSIYLCRDLEEPPQGILLVSGPAVMLGGALWREAIQVARGYIDLNGLSRPWRMVEGREIFGGYYVANDNSGACLIAR